MRDSLQHILQRVHDALQASREAPRSVTTVLQKTPFQPKPEWVLQLPPRKKTDFWFAPGALSLVINNEKIHDYTATFRQWLHHGVSSFRA